MRIEIDLTNDEYWALQKVIRKERLRMELDSIDIGRRSALAVSDSECLLASLSSKLRNGIIREDGGE